MVNLPLIIAYTSIGSVLVPLCIFIFKRCRIVKGLEWLIVLLIVSLLCDLSSWILLRYSVNTYPLVNFYLLAQFSVLYYLFFRHLKQLPILKWIFIFFCCFYITNISFFQGPFQFNSVSNAFASIILMGLSLYYLFTLLKELPTVTIHLLPILWISFAALAYYGGNFFLFLFSNYLTSGIGESLMILWVLHNILNIIKNILFAIALWQAYLNTKLSI